MRSTVLSLLFPITLAIAGCGDDSGVEAYDTLQDCFDDHTTVESLPVQEAITICCLEHPIAGVKPSCGATTAACETIVNAGLADTVLASDITAACTDYQTQLGM